MNKLVKFGLISTVVIGASYGIGCLVGNYIWNHSQTHYVYKVQEGIITMDSKETLAITEEYNKKLLLGAKDFKKCADALHREITDVKIALDGSNSCGDTKYIDVATSYTPELLNVCK